MLQTHHFDRLKALVSLFSANIEQYKSGQYDEANTRTDFIDKFFTLLDWDMANNQGFSESYRDVVREDKVRIDGSQKAPDYSFRIGGMRKYFVEAKKPSVNIAEDKGIEDAYLLLTVAKTKDVYQKLILLFEKANAKYNSGLFAPVDWIDNVRVDDKALSNIIVNLYYPECPYEFSVLPVEILGSIYERFLGKTIRFRAVKGDTHTAIIEEKPEVRRAGGVFYTPQYIVDYIVKNTIGEKIKDKTPDEIANIKICDPACGSGSFLVGAYQYLLNYHLDCYTKAKNIKAAVKNEKIYEAAFKSYKLTISEKQRILTNAIFGVDIDSQAVEVTKLSLYLKLLENEGREAEGRLFRHSDMALLPSLEDNIKCGNSLIGTDFYAQGHLDLSDDDRIKVNCFDWEKESPAIFKDGGFDVVIGNPPYVNIENLDKNAKDYFGACIQYTRHTASRGCSGADFLHGAQGVMRHFIKNFVEKTLTKEYKGGYIFDIKHFKEGSS